MLKSPSATFQPSSFLLYLPSTGLSLPLPSLSVSVSVYCAPQFSPPLSSRPPHLPRAVSTLSSQLLSSIRSFSSPVSFVFPTSSSSTSLSANTPGTLCPGTTLPGLAAPAPPVSLLHPADPGHLQHRRIGAGRRLCGPRSPPVPGPGRRQPFQAAPSRVRHGPGSASQGPAMAREPRHLCSRQPPRARSASARPGTGAVRREGTGSDRAAPSGGAG